MVSWAKDRNPNPDLVELENGIHPVTLPGQYDDLWNDIEGVGKWRNKHVNLMPKKIWALVT